METAIAQADATQAVTPANEQPQTPAVPEGVQKRFDEMTAEKHQLQRQMDEFRARENMYLAELASRAQAPQPQAQPQVQIDPDVAAALDAKFAQYQRRVDQLFTQLQGQQAVLQVRSGAQQHGLPDRIRQRAEELTVQYAQRGYPIDSNVALDLASGQVYREDLAKQQLSQQARQQFNQPNPLFTQQNSLPNLAPAQQVQRPNYDAMPLEQRVAAMEANGVGDLPF